MNRSPGFNAATPGSGQVGFQPAPPLTEADGGTANATMAPPPVTAPVGGVDVECDLEDLSQRADFYRMAEIIDEAGFVGTISNSGTEYSTAHSDFGFTTERDGNYRITAHPYMSGISVSAKDNSGFSMVTGREGKLWVSTVREHLGQRIEDTRAINSLTEVMTEQGLAKGYDDYKGSWESEFGDARILGISPQGKYEDHEAIVCALDEAGTPFEYVCRDIDGNIQMTREDEKVMPSWEAESVLAEFDRRLAADSTNIGSAPTLIGIFRAGVAGTKK